MTDKLKQMPCSGGAAVRVLDLMVTNLLKDWWFKARLGTFMTIILDHCMGVNLMKANLGKPNEDITGTSTTDMLKGCI